jgi:endonuclease/exonuclease/phosphatase family metal-dependent hydrolase
VRILTWNLFHGRAVPERPHSLLDEFSAAIAGWDWDVALLQEVPPWWPEPLAKASGATGQRRVLTSRNCGLWLRRAIASRRPDVLKSGGGGCNAILVRGATITEHRTHRLRWLPERRWVHAVRLEDGTWVGNLHAQVRPHSETRRDVTLAGLTLLDWAAGAPRVVLGGDFNVRDPERNAPPSLSRIPGTKGVDHVLARGLTGRAQRLDAAGLSDHHPVLAAVE